MMPVIDSVEKSNILKRLSWEGSPYQLALFRILLAGQILYASSSKLFDLLLVVKGTSKPTIFPSFIDSFIAAIAVPYLQVAVQLFSLLMLVGLWSKVVIRILFVLFLALFSFWYSKFDAPVQWLYLWFPLLILGFSRCSDVMSLDSYLKRTQVIKHSNDYRWPVELVVGWFAYIYFAAGLAKILPVYKGFSWLSGGTSQGIIYDRFLDSFLYYTLGKPFFDYSAPNWIFGLLSLGSLAIELSCVLLLFTRRFNAFIIILVVSMHFFLYLVGVPGFMQTALILSVCLFAPNHWLFTQLENWNTRKVANKA